jgi:hypothetical protein
VSKKGAGNGPNAQMLDAAADSQQLLAHQMHDKYEAGPEKLMAQGQAQLEAMQTAIGGDPKGFAEHIGRLEGITAQINGFTLTDMASKGGIMEVTVWTSSSGGPRVVEAISSGVDKVKARVIAQAQEIEQARKEALAPAATVPPFRLLEPREATLRYATSAAIGGFVTALAVDVIPYVLMLLVLFTHDEPLLNKPKVRRIRRPDDSAYDVHKTNPWGPPNPPQPAE